MRDDHMNHGHDVERFNRMAKRYERHWLERVVSQPVQRTVLDLAEESVTRPLAILDVGCGTGRLLRAAEQRFPNARLVGVDAAGEMVKEATASLLNGSAIRFQQAVAENLPFPDGEFDLVFSTLTFHHWQDQAKGTAEVGRVLAPGGRWLIADVIPTGLVSFLMRRLKMHRFPERSRFQMLLNGAGLGVTAEQRVRGLGGQVKVLVIAK